MDNSENDSIWMKKFYELLEISSKKITDLRLEKNTLQNELQIAKSSTLKTRKKGYET